MLIRKVIRRKFRTYGTEKGKRVNPTQSPGFLRENRRSRGGGHLPAIFLIHRRGSRYVSAQLGRRYPPCLLLSTFRRWSVSGPCWPRSDHLGQARLISRENRRLPCTHAFRVQARQAFRVRAGQSRAHASRPSVRPSRSGAPSFAPVTTEPRVRPAGAALGPGARWDFLDSPIPSLLTPPHPLPFHPVETAVETRAHAFPSGSLPPD